MSCVVGHEIPDERCKYNNEDEDNSPNIVSDQKYQALSQNIR